MLGKGVGVELGVGGGCWGCGLKVGVTVQGSTSIGLPSWQCV